MEKTVKVSRSELQRQLDIDKNFDDITGSTVTGWAATIAGWIFKKSPIGVTVLYLQTIVQADASRIASNLRYMLENDYSYFVITTSYKYRGYMPGSSYETYDVEYQTYSYQ